MRIFLLWMSVSNPSMMEAMTRRKMRIAHVRAMTWIQALLLPTNWYPLLIWYNHFRLSKNLYFWESYKDLQMYGNISSMAITLRSTSLNQLVTCHEIPCMCIDTCRLKNHDIWRYFMKDHDDWSAMQRGILVSTAISDFPLFKHFNFIIIYII